MTSHLTENNKFSLKSIVSDKLTNKEIKEICLLKDKQWKFGIKSLIKWFKSNPFTTSDDTGRVIKTLFRSFYDTPNVLYINNLQEQGIQYHRTE